MREVHEAARRVDKFLDTREPMTGLDPERIAQVASRLSDNELVDLKVSDLRILVAIAENAVDLLDLHSEVVTHKGKPYEFHFCDHCNVRYPCDTVSRLRFSSEG